MKKPLLDQTLELWQPRYPRTLTPEDARQIAENLVGFFRILLEWDEQRREIDRRAAGEAGVEGWQPHTTHPDARPRQMVELGSPDPQDGRS